VKVWISYGQFESTELGAGITQARSIFEKGYESLKVQGLKEERLILLEAWKECERAASISDAKDADDEMLVRGIGDVSLVEVKFPKKIKMRRMVKADDGTDLGWEEYYEYHFPDDEKKVIGLKILENAMKWKQAMGGGGNSSSATDDATEQPDSMLGKRKVNSEELDIDNI
jgi:crooked neck